MTCTVQFTTFIEDFGWDVDTKEFDNLKDAWNFYLKIKDTDDKAQLWSGDYRKPGEAFRLA